MIFNKKKMNKVWIASFDIGKKNFSFYIEEFSPGEIKCLEKVPKKDRYNIDGTTTEKFSEILRSVCKKGRKVLLVNADLTEGCDKRSYLDTETFHNLTDLLEKYSQYWDKCATFIIEKQMSFGKRHNTMAIKIGQHCWSYFAFRYGRFKNIIEFPAYHKTQILGAQKLKKKGRGGKTRYKAIDKPARKKWCISKALDILAEREDFDTMSQISSSRKKDDLCDVICQLQAYKCLEFLT